MISSKNALVFTAVLLSALIITAEKGSAAPTETSHWNSNTFGNLNTLADKTTVTFSITYNETGTIDWFKDGVLADTLSDATSAQFTTSWSETGMKEVKARMTNGGGVSAVTVWPVEVQEMGTATLLKATTYPQPRISGNPTLDVTNGWVNFPTLYLKTREPDDWIEYVSSGTYIIKADIDIRTNAILKADDGSAKVLKICAVPKKPGNATGTIRAYLGGTINIDSMTIMGWNRDQGTEISNDSTSAVIRSREEGTLRLTNCECRHVEVHFESDNTPGDLLDHNNFDEANPFILNLADSKYQVITNNRFYHGRECNVFAYNGGYGYNLIENNQFIGAPTCGDNFLVGKGSKIIGNEFTYAGWNLAEIHTDMFCRNNILHDNGGNHNGFNGMIKNVYSYNDYCYDFTGFSGFYSQLKDDLRTYPTPMDWYPDHIYIINGRAKNVPCGFNFFGGFNIYVYNFTCEKTGGNLQYGSDKFFVRKSSFTETDNISGDFAFRIVDWATSNYGFVGTATLMDSVINGPNSSDFGYYPAGNAVFNVINCIKKDSEGKIVVPTNYFYKGYVLDWAHPEMRYYVWLDVLVKDRNGHLIKDANVTMECLNDPSAPTLKVTLPPPPPDLWDMPAEPLPQPVLGNFVRLKTLSTGKLPGPNYGWSAIPEPCVALPFKRMVASKSSGDVTINTITGYQYRIKAAYHGLEASQTVTPDATWLREDPTLPANTVELILNGDATTGADTVPPILTITSPQNNKPVAGTVTVAATASDNWDIDRLEIFVDNVSRAVISADSCTWTADSYSCSWDWDTAQENDGSHSIKVIAYDVSGNMTERTITVEVLTNAVSLSDDAVVYPNPYIKGKSRGNTCVFANLAPDADVRIYGISGELITTLSTETSGDRASAEWDVSQVGGGIYLYTIHSSKGVQKGKIGIVK